jgi:DNA-binding CsgD family transcriptional regulator
MSAVDKAALREANARAHRIRAGIASYLTTLADVAAAYRERDWHTLGYADWSAYVEGEFSAQRLRLTPEHRQKAVEELRLAGLSQRAIGTALGVSVGTVNADLSGVQNRTPDEIQGSDGKTYSSTRPSPIQPGTDDQDHPTSGEARAGLAALPAEADGTAMPSAGDGEAGPPVPASPQTAVDAPISSVDGPAPNRHGGPAAGPTSSGPAVTPDQEFMSRFVGALAKAGGWMQFDPDRVAELASETTWDAIEAHAEVVAHTYERMRKQRFALRLIEGGVA